MIAAGLFVLQLVQAGSPPVAAAAMPADPPTFTLEEAYRLVRERSPLLRAATMLTEATAAREGSAGLPPDPALQIGFMNLSVPGFDADMPASMAPSIQLMQMLPLYGKLGLSKRVAEQSTAMTKANAEEAWWDVRSRTALAFYTMYEVDRKLEVMRETLRLLRDFEQVARAMYSAGDGRQSDVLRASVEVARMEAEIRRMQAMRTGAAARLNGLLNRPADTAIPAPAFGSLPLDVPALETLRGWADETRPMLERARISVEQAGTREKLARREIWPDPVIGVAYGQRNADMGTERMGSVMLGFSIPVFAQRRQLRMRDEAAAMRSMADAELAEMRAGVDARLAELLAELERTRTLLELYRSEILPQSRANVQASMSSYRVGKVDFMTLVDAQMTANQHEQEYFGLMGDYGRFIAELEMAVGRELPRSGPMLAEAS